MIPFTSLEPPVGAIRLKGERTLVYIDNVSKGLGTLYITENNIVWINDCHEGFTLDYPDLSIFAVCTDLEKYPENCVYILTQSENATQDEYNNSDDDEEFDEETEIRFAPSEGTDIHDLFNCIQECNRLHRAPHDDSISDDEFGNEEEDSSDAFGEINAQENVHSFMNGNGDSTNSLNGQFDDVE